MMRAAFCWKTRGPPSKETAWHDPCLDKRTLSWRSLSLRARLSGRWSVLAGSMDCFARRESAAEKGAASVDVERIEAIVDEL